LKLFKVSSIAILVFLAVGVFSHVHAQVEEIVPSNALYYYSGTIETEQVEFNLQLKGQSVSGSYIIESSGDMYVFAGRLAYNKKGIGVLVYNKDNNYVASIEAVFVNEESNFGKHMNGSWKSANGRVIKKLKLKKVAEYASVPDLFKTDTALGE